MQYSDGEAITVGDKIRYNNQPGTVVILNAVSADPRRFDTVKWDIVKNGLLIEFDNGALLHLEKIDDLLQLSRRAEN